MHKKLKSIISNHKIGGILMGNNIFVFKCEIWENFNEELKLELTRVVDNFLREKNISMKKISIEIKET